MKKMTFWGRNEEDENLLWECMTGLKTATCTPLVWYEEDAEAKSEPGDLFEVYTKKGVLACTIAITENYQIRFGDIKGSIGEKIAAGENSTLEQYIEDHIFCWEVPLKEQGLEFNSETVIVVEHFKVVEPFIDPASLKKD